MNIYTLLFKPSPDRAASAFTKPFYNEKDMREFAASFESDHGLRTISTGYGNCEETGEDDARLVDSDGKACYFLFQKHTVDCHGEVFNESNIDDAYDAGVSHAMRVRFPNGFSNWNETHYEVSSVLHDIYESGNNDFIEALSTGELWELVELLTDEFEKTNLDREVHDDYLSSISELIQSKIPYND
jgi:hypothetical protein